MATSMRMGLRGFTLIEVLVTMGIAGVLLALAVPAFNAFVLNDRDIGQINSLVASLNYARSEAIKQNIAAGITVCPSNGGTPCSGTANWSGGWIVWDSNLLHQPLQSIPAFAGGNTLSTTPAALTAITFLSNGMTNAGGTVKLKICDPRGAAYARDVEINATGRIAASQVPGHDVNQAVLTCP